MFNYRHPGPRRVWKGGSQPQLTTSFPDDPENSRDPRACSETLILAGKIIKIWPWTRSEIVNFRLWPKLGPEGALRSSGGAVGVLCEGLEELGNAVGREKVVEHSSQDSCTYSPG